MAVQQRMKWADIEDDVEMEGGGVIVTADVD